MAKCLAATKSGKRCSMPQWSESKHGMCQLHDPEIQERRKVSIRKAAKAGKFSRAARKARKKRNAGDRVDAIAGIGLTIRQMINDELDARFEAFAESMKRGNR